MARRRELNSDQWRRSQLFINQAGEQYGRTAHTHTMQSGAATVAGHQSAIGIVTRTELANLSAGASPTSLQVSKKSILKSIINLGDFHNYYVLPHYY
jgi:phosphopentomutase